LNFTRPSVRSLISAAQARIEFIQLEPSGAMVASLIVWALAVDMSPSSTNPVAIRTANRHAGVFLVRQEFMNVPYF